MDSFGRHDATVWEGPTLVDLAERFAQQDEYEARAAKRLDDRKAGGRDNFAQHYHRQDSRRRGGAATNRRRAA
jgi:hypothetical protein